MRKIIATLDTLIIISFCLLAVLVVVNASIANNQKMNKTYLEKFAKNLKKILYSN